MKRTRQDAPTPLDVVLDASGEDRFAPYKPPVARRVWRAVVGARIAERAEPALLERGVLVVKVATSVWASELSMLSATIIQRLREEKVDVTELRFRVGPVEPPARPAERRVSRAVPAPAALPKDLGDALRDVPDLELRETIALAARANLAWQEHVKEPPARSGIDHAAAEPQTCRPTSAPPAARAPRSSGRGNDPPGRT
jgi:predicted nucleic acid-binding Zn ribbon protein